MIHPQAGFEIRTDTVDGTVLAFSIFCSLTIVIGCILLFKTNQQLGLRGKIVEQALQEALVCLNKGEFDSLSSLWFSIPQNYPESPFRNVNAAKNANQLAFLAKEITTRFDRLASQIQSRLQVLSALRQLVICAMVLLLLEKVASISTGLTLQRSVPPADVFGLLAEYVPEIQFGVLVAALLIVLERYIELLLLSRISRWKHFAAQFFIGLESRS